jgi:hypothetical protein
MTGAAPLKLEVYAVVRIDVFLGPDARLEEMVTVKEVLPTVAEAESEVGRLNALVEQRDVRYVVQPTRYYPSGRNRAWTAP